MRRPRRPTRPDSTRSTRSSPSSATAPSSSSRAKGSTRSRSRHELDELGDSLLVVGDATALKIHVHTDDPGRALALGTALGTIEGVEIANMHKQTEQRSERILESGPDPELTLETGVVAVVPGDGNRRLFESYGAAR